MESPSQWGQSAFLEDTLPCTSAFVAPGQEDFFFGASRGLDGSAQKPKFGSLPASPSEYPRAGAPASGPFSSSGGDARQAPQYPGGLQPAPQFSPSHHADYQASLYQNGLSQEQYAHLAALDLAAGRTCPAASPGGAHNSPSAAHNSPRFGSIPCPSQAFGMMPLPPFGQPHLADPRLVGAIVSTGGAHPPPHPYSQLSPSGSPHHGSAANMPPPAFFPHQFPAAPGQIQSGHVNPLEATLAPPLPPQPMHSMHPPIGSTAPGPDPAGGYPYLAGSAPTATSPPAPSLPVEGLGANASPRSPHASVPAPSFALSSIATAGGSQAAIRHVVSELRTSPLGASPGNLETPVRPSMGSRGSNGGALGAGGTSGEKSGTVQRYQAQILSLERQNAELQKRVADMQAALEAAQQARQALEAKQDSLVDEAAQANSNAKTKEGALETARRANDALSGELRSCQEDLAAARNQLAEAKDTAVQWQDRAMELNKELDAARKKIEALGEAERRLSNENMALRKEVQQLNEGIIKGRIESSELREKLRQAQQESARAASTVQALASRAESEHEGAAVQMSMMRNRVVELEARNSQLLYDLAGFREEAARARQAADAAKAALAAKPAGIISEAGPTSRPQGSSSWMRHAEGTTSGGAGPYSGGGGGGGGYGGTGGGAGYSTGGYGMGQSLGGAYGPAGSAGGGYARLPLPAPPPPGGTGGGAATQPDASGPPLLRDLPHDVAFSKLDPETFRSMVRAEAEALSRGGDRGGAGGPSNMSFMAHDAGLPAPGSPLHPSYGNRDGGPDGLRRPYDQPGSGGGGGGGGGLSGQGPIGFGNGNFNGVQTRVAWAAGVEDVGNVRGSLALADSRPQWPADSRSLGGDQLASTSANTWQQQQQQFNPTSIGGVNNGGPAGGGGGGGGGGGSNAYTQARGVSAPGGAAGGAQPSGPSSPPPPPYATYTADNSYAYRRPSNAVGAGLSVPAASGGGGAGGGPNGGGGGPHGAGETPFGTEVTVKDMMARSKALEDQLMVLCAEKGGLEAEYARMPLGAGRNLRERNRKAVVEQRLELLNKEISSVRMQLKRLGVK